MSRAIIIVALMALSAVCLVQAGLDYSSLFNPTLLTLEEAIKHSVTTVKPRIPDEWSLDEMGTREYTLDFLETKSMHKKIWYLKLDYLDETRELVVKAVLDNVKNQFEASSHEEAKKVLRKACSDLARDLKPALAVTEREIYYDQKYISDDKDLLRLFDLYEFCKIL